jgi:hypothetical protein
MQKFGKSITGTHATHAHQNRQTFPVKIFDCVEQSPILF